MKEHTREEPRIVAAAERQMQAHSLAEQIAQQGAKTWRFDEPRPHLGEYITVSREAGAGGGEIAELLGRKLGWEVLDKKLVECVAQRYHLSKPMLERVDETASNWASDVFGSWFDSHAISHEKYVVRLCRVVIAAARRGNVVLVGRGAHLILPRDQGLAVRIIASPKYRIARIARQFGFSEAQARQYVAEVDRGRREFVMRYFHHDIHDPQWFDLVLRVDRIGPESAAELIADTYLRCSGSR